VTCFWIEFPKKEIIYYVSHQITKKGNKTVKKIWIWGSIIAFLGKNIR